MTAAKREAVAMIVGLLVYLTLGIWGGHWCVGLIPAAVVGLVVEHALFAFWRKK